MVDLRKEAKGRQCQVRLVGICNGNAETVVLAHYRMAGINGIGLKPEDVIGAWACSACHDACDGRMKTEFNRMELEYAHLQGLVRTLVKLIREGKIKYE